ncbi:MAG TPA: GNAT family N-acetyltransferase [Propionibacterium sp.]|nr:GNAT family N-acetyltransferase [Propionibacterium sp.]
MTIREVTPDDIPAILGLVQELATYEREPDATKGTVEGYRRALFPEDGRPVAYAHVAEIDGAVVGLALYYLTFSTWEGVPGMWLEDLYVQPAHRGTGLGKEMLLGLAELCVRNGWTRLEWCVLNWNTPAIDFYHSLGASPMDEWTTYRLDGKALEHAGSLPAAGVISASLDS